MSTFSESHIESFFQTSIPGETLRASPKRLKGGNLNIVWRLEGNNKSYILKYAPPYIASAPEILLDPSRITFEAKMLQLFEDNAALSSVTGTSIRPPLCYTFDPQRHLLLMEEIAPHQELDSLLQNQFSWERLGAQLGQFIGTLHNKSVANPELAQRFNNQSIQQTRLDVQYRPVEACLEQAGSDQSQACGKRAVALGEKYCTTGCCLVMGDLWPRSIMLHPNQESVRLIDWEFAHYGQPAQDVAHFAAHCWMMAQQKSEQKEGIGLLWHYFADQYRQVLGERFDGLWDARQQEDALIHAGSEILVRTIGNFQQGYLYEGLAHDSKIIQDALQFATSLIAKSRQVDLFFNKPLNLWNS